MSCTILRRDTFGTFGRCARAGLAALALGLALACSVGADAPGRSAFTAEVLDSIESEMERLSGERWPTWTMRIEDETLAFEIEVRAGHGEVAQRRDCAAIGTLMRERAGNRPWSAELVRQGRLLRRCSHATAAAAGSTSPLG
jgi:hypothetical protein